MLHGVHFTCRATPTDFAATRGWFSIGGAKIPSRDIVVGLDDYNSLIQCCRKLQPDGKTFVSGDHGPTTEPKHL